MPAETLRAVEGFDLRSGISGANQSSHQTLGCSKPLPAGDVVHVVLNEQMASGVVLNHFATVNLDAALSNGDCDASWGGSGGGGGGPGGSAGQMRSWCSTGTGPVRAIQALDDECTTLIYAKRGLFCFATGPREGNQASTPASTGAGSPRARANAAAAAAVWGGGGSAVGVAGIGGGGAVGGAGGGGGGNVFESLPIHSGTVVDFRVNPISRDIVSGCDHGHVHVVNFPPEMAGVPTMKVSKYVAQPLSSVRWGLGERYVASWTSSRGVLQMLDTRDYRMVSSIQVEGSLPVHTHEHLSDVVVAVGCGVGCVQLFDLRKMEAFVTLQDPVAGSIQQILSRTSDRSSGWAASSPNSLGDWVTFGTGGVSRYTVAGSSGGTVDVSPGEGLLTRVANELSYAAGCRTSDMTLAAGLDTNAGLFLAPSGTKQQRLCGITLDSRIVTFGAAFPPPGATTATSTPMPMPMPTAKEPGGGGIAGPMALPRALAPVAPADGTTLPVGGAGVFGRGGGGGGGGSGDSIGRSGGGGAETAGAGAGGADGRGGGGVGGSNNGWGSGEAQQVRGGGSGSDGGSTENANGERSGGGVRGGGAIDDSGSTGFGGEEGVRGAPGNSETMS